MSLLRKMLGFGLCKVEIKSEEEKEDKEGESSTHEEIEMSPVMASRPLIVTVAGPLMATVGRTRLG
jgi:hypothetical protein